MWLEFGVARQGEQLPIRPRGLTAVGDILDNPVAQNLTVVNPKSFSADR